MTEKDSVSSKWENRLTFKYNYSHSDASSLFEGDLVAPGHSLNYHLQFLLFLNIQDALHQKLICNFAKHKLEMHAPWGWCVGHSVHTS